MRAAHGCFDARGRFRRQIAVAALFTASVGFGCAKGSGHFDHDPADGPSAGNDANAEPCSDAGQKAYLLRLFRHDYLWNDSLPAVELDDYPTAYELLEALRYRTIDADGHPVVVDRWSWMEPKADHEKQKVAGMVLGTGVDWALDADGAVRAGFVHRGSEADRAGLARGARLRAVDGVPLSEIPDAEIWDAVDGPDAPGVEVRYDLEAGDGAARTVTLIKDWYAVDVVSTAVIASQAGSVGYVRVASFVGTTAEASREAFAELEDAGVEELVVDLRYNWGGLYDATLLLGSLIAGSEHAGDVLAWLRYNEDLRTRDRTLNFAAEPHAIGVRRVVFLVGEQTASASELLISGLRPYLDVTLLGPESTQGKPYGADFYENCGQVIVPITVAVTNADGFGHYDSGLEPDCVVQDDFDHALGDPEEAELSGAIHFVETGECPTGG